MKRFEHEKEEIKKIWEKKEAELKLLEKELRDHQLKLLKIEMIESLEKKVEQIEQMSLSDFEYQYDLFSYNLSETAFDISIQPKGKTLLKVFELIQLSQVQKDVLKVIGEEGISRTSELYNHSNLTSYSSSSLADTVKKLYEFAYLERDELRLGARGGYNFAVFKLSNLGKDAYEFIFRKKSVLSEMEQFEKEYPNLTTAYLIKEVVQTLEESNWKFINHEKMLSKFIVNDTERVIYISHFGETQNQFFEIFDRLYELDKTLYFVAPNEEVLYGNIKVWAFKWLNERLGGIASAKGITLCFATLEKLKKQGKWETIPL